MYHKQQLCGPGGVRDCVRKIDADHLYVGEGAMSMEGTSQVDYLWRGPPKSPFPRSRSHKVGEVGWAVAGSTDWDVPNTGHQIQLGEFRQMVEDRYTHLFQNAWYPGPREDIDPDSDAGLVMNVYKPSTARSNRSSRAKSQERGPSRAGSVYSSPSDHSVHSNSNNNNNTAPSNQYRYTSKSSYETY